MAEMELLAEKPLLNKIDIFSVFLVVLWFILE